MDKQKKKQIIDKDINVLNCMGDSVASVNDCTGLIPRESEIEAASEFYEEMYDYLPHGVIPEDKYSED